MTDPGFRDRHHTIYLPTKEDLERWRSLAAPLTLNRWIYLMVEKALEGEQQQQTKTADDINAFRGKNQALFKQVVELTQQNKLLTARLKAKETSFLGLHEGAVSLLRGGGCWTSINILGALNLAQKPSEKVKERIKSVEFTLAQLEAVGLITKQWNGWKWNVI